VTQAVRMDPLVYARAAAEAVQQVTDVLTGQRAALEGAKAFRNRELSGFWG
jgi:hypothetical protein